MPYLRKIWLLSVLCVMAIPASGAILQLSFDATIRDIDGNHPGIDNFGIVDGAAIRGYFLLDSSVAGSAITSNVWFNGAVVGARMSMGSLNGVLNTDGFYDDVNYIVIHNGTFDAIAISAPITANPATGVNVGFMGLQLFDSSANILDDTLFPSLPSLSDVDAFGSGQTTEFTFVLSGGGISYAVVTAEVTALSSRQWRDAANLRSSAVVPLPATLPLLACAILGLAGLGQRAASPRSCTCQR